MTNRCGMKVTFEAAEGVLWWDGRKEEIWTNFDMTFLAVTGVEDPNTSSWFHDIPVKQHLFGRLGVTWWKTTAVFDWKILIVPESDLIHQLCSSSTSTASVWQARTRNGGKHDRHIKMYAQNSGWSVHFLPHQRDSSDQCYIWGVVSGTVVFIVTASSRHRNSSHH